MYWFNACIYLGHWFVISVNGYIFISCLTICICICSSLTHVYLYIRYKILVIYFEDLFLEETKSWTLQCKVHNFSVSYTWMQISGKSSYLSTKWVNCFKVMIPRICKRLKVVAPASIFWVIIMTWVSSRSYIFSAFTCCAQCRAQCDH